MNNHTLLPTPLYNSEGNDLDGIAPISECKNEEVIAVHTTCSTKGKLPSEDSN